jgi:hypothetical protein
VIPAKREAEQLRAIANPYPIKGLVNRGGCGVSLSLGRAGIKRKSNPMSRRFKLNPGKNLILNNFQVSMNCKVLVDKIKTTRNNPSQSQFSRFSRTISG